MRKYDKQNLCPKCGEPDAKVKYCFDAISEFMIRSCVACEYKWKEEPLNKRKKQ